MGLDDSEFNQKVNKNRSTFDGLKTGVAVAATAIGVAAAGMFVSAVKTGSEFEAQMSRVKAISGATAGEFKQLSEQAKALGAETAFSASEAADGMENLASAGFGANEIMGAMPGLLDLAAVSGGDVAAASEVAATSLRAFGLEASEAGHVANVFAKAAADTNAEALDMGEAMKYVAPVAKAMGQSLEETAAAIGIMSDAGIKGSQAGTTLRGALARLAKPTTAMREEMDWLNVSFYDAEGQMIPLRDQVELLKSSFEGLTQEEQNHALVTLYGQESLSGMLALIEAGPQKLDDLTKSLENSDGAAEAMAKIMQNNLKGSVEELGGALETLGIETYESFQKPLRKAVDEGTKGVNRLTREFKSPTMQSAIKSLGDSFADMVKLTADFAQKAIPLLTKGLAFAADNADVLAVAIGGAIVATKGWSIASAATQWVNGLAESYRVTSDALLLFRVNSTNTTLAQAALNGTMTASQVVVGALSGQIGIATAAQSLWNMAMAANPIGLLIGAAAALSAGIIVLNKITKKETEEQKAAKESIEESAAAYEDFTSAIQSAKEAYDNEVDSARTNAEVASNLIGKIEQLSNKQNRSAAETLKLKLYIDQLNEVLPDTNAYYNEQTGLVEGLNAETKERVKNLLKEAEAEANKKYAIELMEQQSEAKRKLAKAEAELQSLQEQGLDTYFHTGLAMQEQTSEAIRAQENIENWKNKLLGLEVEIEGFTDSMVESGTQQNALISAQDEQVNQLAETWGILPEEVSASAASMNMSIEEWREYQEESLKKQKETLESYTESATSMYDRIKTSGSIAVSEMIANLEHNQAAVEQWSDNLVTLSDRGLSRGLIQKLREAGPESAAQVNAIVNASDEEISKLTDVFDNGTNTAVDAMMKTMGLDNVVNSGSKMVDDISDGVDKNTSLKDSTVKIVEEAKKAAEAQAKKSDFQSIGTFITDGIALGIRNGTSNIVSAINEAIQKAHAAAQKADEQHSPSKWWERFAKNDMLGMANGFVRNAGEVISAQDKVFSKMHENAMDYSSPDVSVDVNYAAAPFAARLAPVPAGAGFSLPPITINLYGGATRDDGNMVGRAVAEHLGDLYRRLL